MVFTQNLLLEYSNQTSQVSPRLAHMVKRGTRLSSAQVESHPDRLARGGEMRSSPILTSLRSSEPGGVLGVWNIREGFLEEEVYVKPAHCLMEKEGPVQGNGLTALAG